MNEVKDTKRRLFLESEQSPATFPFPSISNLMITFLTFPFFSVLHVSGNRIVHISY